MTHIVFTLYKVPDIR